MPACPLTKCKSAMGSILLLMLLGTCGPLKASDLNAQLITAVHLGDVDATKALIANGANVEARDSSEGSQPTALIIAAQNGYPAIVKLLLTANAKVDGRNASGSTPLIEAAKEGRTEIVLLLLDHKADIKAKNVDGDTAFKWAAAFGRTDTVKALIGKGADVNQRCGEGETPLIAACLDGHIETVKLLLAAGADVNATDAFGMTPLKTAEGKHKEIVELLRASGAKE
jgi:ankyrin repeat protein